VRGIRGALRPSLRCVAIAATLLWAGCDDDDGGGTVEGTGYSFTLPAAWQDVSDSDELKDRLVQEDPTLAGVDYDSLATDDPEDDFAANINVLRGQSRPGDVIDDQYIRKFARGAEAGISAAGLTPSGTLHPKETELGGERAIEFFYANEQQGKQLRYRVVFSLHDDAAYTLTFTALADRFDTDDAEFDQILDSWRWQ
jgi:hypothetical protein